MSAPIPTDIQDTWRTHDEQLSTRPHRALPSRRDGVPRCRRACSSVALRQPPLKYRTTCRGSRRHNGRHALIVDGAPFFMLGAQVNNSSNYPEPLATAWPVLDRIGANTVEVPVAWEQVEAQGGQVRFQLCADLARPGSQRTTSASCSCGSAHGKTLRSPTRPTGSNSTIVAFPRMKTKDGHGSWCAQRARRGDACGRQARFRPADDISARSRCAEHRHYGAGRKRNRQL